MTVRAILFTAANLHSLHGASTFRKNSDMTQRMGQFNESHELYDIKQYSLASVTDSYFDWDIPRAVSISERYASVRRMFFVTVSRLQPG